MENRWLRRFAVVVATCALLLVIAGGLVTSNDAAMSVPDWPLSWGKLVPPLEGGIRFEFAHRALAATLAVLTLVLAVWLGRAEPRRWVCRLGWLAVAAVAAQALLGGAVVRFVSPKPLAILHACFAQLCFGLLVAVAVALAGLGDVAGRKPAPLAAAAALLLQTILGAAVRHSALVLIPHIAGAVVSTVIVMWAGLQVLSRHMENATLRRPAMLLLSFTFSQVFLGMGAYMGRVVNADAPQPLPMMIWFTVAHVAVGSLAFGAAVALAMIVGRHDSPAQAALPHGGVLVA